MAKHKFSDLFWDFVLKLIDTFSEIRSNIIDPRPRVNVRKLIQEIFSNMPGPFFGIRLREDERLFDFSKGRFEAGGVMVVVKAGQYRLERKMIRWGSNNPEDPWLVLENTTIGAREAWWKKQLGISLRLDADL